MTTGTTLAPTDCVAVVSLLHEPATAHSATRNIGDTPVLTRTLERIKAAGVEDVVGVCWSDQRAAAEACGLGVIDCGDRAGSPLAGDVAADVGLRWHDGWRGAPGMATGHDAGYLAPAVQQAIGDKSAVVLIDPAAALLDPAALAETIENCGETGRRFLAGPRGLGGFAMTRGHLDALAATGRRPGMELNYQPWQPELESIALANATPTEPGVLAARVSCLIDTDDKAAWLAATDEPATPTPTAADAVAAVRAYRPTVPREVTLELTTNRATRPVWRRGLDVRRPDLTPALAEKVIEQVAGFGGRLTLGGFGDPLLSPIAADVIRAAADAGVPVHVETDLAAVTPDAAAALARADLVSVHLPAMTPATYAAVMGTDAMPAVLANLAVLLQNRPAGTPLVVPTFVKLAANLHELPQWYDRWLGALNAAVVVGPSNAAGELTPLTVGGIDMSPPRRFACGRLGERVTVLSDGAVVACEEDVTGRSPLGDVGDGLVEVWRGRRAGLLRLHEERRWDESLTCAGCDGWHR